MIKYQIDKSSKTTYCVIDTNAVGYRCLVTAKTRCHDEDVFDEEKGKKIAYKKALIKLKTQEIQRLSTRIAMDKIYEQVIKRYQADCKALENARNVRKSVEQELVDLIN